MNRKKIIIISLVVAGAVVFIALMFLKDRENNNIPVTMTPTENNSNTNTNNNFISQPAGNSDTANTLMSSSVITVNDPNDSKEVKDAFNKFVSLPLPTHQVEWTNIEDDNKNNITLDQFSSGTGLNINQSLYNLINTDTFDLFSCSTTGSAKNVGINFTLKLLPNYNGDLYTNETIFMKNWEKTMLQDVAPILFPDVTFSAQQLQQNIIFKDVFYKYAQARTADVILPDGEKSSITYDIVDDYVIISNSPQCVDNADYQLFTPDD